MLLPQAWLRRRRLQRALVDYPLYDPPHKVEERVLPKKLAVENFDYFMRVRHDRLAHFQAWLRQYFGVTITPDAKGVLALNRWGSKYAGLLLVKGEDGHPTDTYFNYDPTWTGEYAGHNVLFDMGIALGEFIIVNCPKLYWDVDPISAVLPGRARRLKQDSGTSFQRPRLTGSDNPSWSRSTLHDVYIFAAQMADYTETLKGANELRSFPREMRYNIIYMIKSNFDVTIRYYPKNDPHNLRGEMDPKDYLKLMDSEEDEGDDHE